MDEGTLSEFVAGHYRRLVGAMTLMTGSRAAAEDAVQEALARAWERSERGERIESLRAWVTTVATNLSRSRFRRLTAERAAIERLPIPQHLSGHDLDETLDLRGALAALPRRQREVTVLYYFLDLSVAEVGRLLGISEGATKNALYLARQSLATALRLEEEVNDVPPGG